MRRSWFLPVFLLVALTIPTFSRADEWAPPGRVLRARYGIDGHFINVTSVVRHYAPDGKMDVCNHTFGFDPFKGEKKRLPWFSIHRTAATKETTTKATPSVLVAGQVNRRDELPLAPCLHLVGRGSRKTASFIREFGTTR
jgi:hypothetical protein